MHMINIRRAFAGITLGMIALFTATTPGAQAATPTPHTVATVCTTGFRGQPAYDKACLTHGTPHTAARLWNSVPEGKPGSRRHDDMTSQRNICAYAAHHGGIMAWSRELVGDMTYDSYRNNEEVNRWVGQDATLTCAQLGYRI